MERQVINGAQMTVIVTDDLVVLQVPALDLPVLAAGEEVGLAAGDGQAAHHAHMTRQGELQLPAGQVPDLDDAVRGAGGEPLVTRLDGAASDPAHVAGYDAVELPWGVPRGFRHGGGPADGQLAASGPAHRRLHHHRSYNRNIIFNTKKNASVSVKDPRALKLIQMKWIRIQENKNAGRPKTTRSLNFIFQSAERSL